MSFLAEAIAWLDNERAKIGAIDGYDYRSGEEYGLRRAQLHLEKMLRDLPAAPLQHS